MITIKSIEIRGG
ncbi:hypothetical protein PF001_g20858, partial [Phytophthora fragariae]